uniref:Uncharacterized protein n=1 Tax=Arundo donax TaxID=35708 RepID=A0A0A9EL60_ARUDO
MREFRHNWFVLCFWFIRPVNFIKFCSMSFLAHSKLSTCTF